MRANKIIATPSFLKTLEKLEYRKTKVYKIYYFIFYRIPKFFKTLYHFRKELWQFRPYDYTYNLQLLKKSLELTRDNIRDYGYEIESSRNKKIAKMDRAIIIMNNILEDNYLEIAEQQLNKKFNAKLDFIKLENSDDYELIDLCSETERSINSEIIKLSKEIEDIEWSELWEIFKGQPENNNINIDYDEYFDGSNMKSWWD